MSLPQHPDLHGDMQRELAFWPWFARTGVRTLVDAWLVIHVGIGFALATAVTPALSQVAQNVFLPFASVLVGLAFAWGGNAMAVLQSRELHEIGKQPVASDAYRDWVFQYQFAILVVMLVLVVWALAALGVTDRVAQLIPHQSLTACRLAGRTAAFALSSVAIRESWSVVLGVHSMLLAQNRYRLEQGQTKPPP